MRKWPRLVTSTHLNSPQLCRCFRFASVSWGRQSPAAASGFRLEMVSTVCAGDGLFTAMLFAAARRMPIQVGSWRPLCVSCVRLQAGTGAEKKKPS